MSGLLSLAMGMTGCMRFQTTVNDGWTTRGFGYCYSSHVIFESSSGGAVVMEEASAHVWHLGALL